MKFTEIRYKYERKVYETVVVDNSYRCGDISYHEGVANIIKSLVDSGATIVDIIQH